MILSLLAFVLLSSSLGALGRSLNNSDSCRQLLESKFPHLCDRLGDLEPLGWACEQLTLWQSRLVPEVPLSLRQSDWLFHLHTCRGSSCFAQDDKLDYNSGTSESQAEDFLDFEEEEGSSTGMNDTDEIGTEGENEEFLLLEAFQTAHNLVGEPADSQGDEISSSGHAKITRGQMATLCVRLQRIDQPIDLVDRILNSWQSVDDRLRTKFRRWKRKCGQLQRQLKSEGRTWRSFVAEAVDYAAIFEPNVNGLNTFVKAVRKEYRLMSAEERDRFHRAFNALLEETIDGRSKIDVITSRYTSAVAPEAHWGPAFLPYHREFLKQVELAMRNEDPHVSLPYWDTTLDADLPNPKDSIIWSEDFLGSGVGFVSDGPFSHWNLTRSNNGSGRLLNQTDLGYIMSQSGFSQLTFCVDPTFELLVHLSNRFIDGSSQDDVDPATFMVWTFADFIWEKFRRTRQADNQRQYEYPQISNRFGLCQAYHAAEAQMSPFELQNRMGLTDVYLDEFYSYEDSPTCNVTQTDCRSEFLFCDTRRSRCVSKVRLNGICAGFENFSICIKGACVRGICSLERNISSKANKIPGKVEVNGTTTKTTLTVSTTASPPPTSIYPNFVVYDRGTNPPISTTPSKIQTTTARTVPSLGTELPNAVPILISSHESDSGEELGDPKTSSPAVSSTSATSGPIDAVVPLVQSASGSLNSSVWFTVSVVKGNGHFRVPVRGATIRTKGLNTPPGFTEEMEGKVLSGQYSYPYYIGAAVAQVRDPSHFYSGIIEFNVTVTNDKGVKCRPTCFSRPKYANCTGRLRLSRNSYYSDPIQFKPTIREALETMWTVAAFRTRIPDYLIFQCP